MHSDIWGPASVETINRKQYFVSFTDDYSRFSNIYLIRKKDEAFSCYRKYEAWLGTQHCAIIKRLHTDRGGEYLSTEFNDHLQLRGTVRRLTVHDTPEYNGLPEQLNRTLMEKVRAMLHDSQLPKFLWGEALNHAVYLKNRTWTRALKGTTPFEILTGSKPNLSTLHPWGSRVWVHDTSGSKLDGRAKEGYWVGFDEESRAHRIYWAVKRSVTVERSIKFVPDDIILDHVPLEGEEKLDERNEDESNWSERSISPKPDSIIGQISNEDEPTPPPDDNEGMGRGRRIRKESANIRRLREGEGHASNLPASHAFPRGLQLVPDENEEAGMVEEVGVEDFAMATVMEAAEGLNPTLHEARKRSDWPKWQEAMKAEIMSLKANGTWKVVERPQDTNVVDCKWVLCIKKNAAGEIDKYKARLVARGFTQIHGVDYYETYAPVARLSSFQLLIALANRNEWPIESFDFDSTFLNSVLGDNEVVYLEQPADFSEADPKRYVFRLVKALYGLKQGAKSWYDALCQALSELGFRRSEADHGVFVKEGKDSLILLAVHVDDCMVTGHPASEIGKFKVEINEKYKMTDLGACTWLLRIRLNRNTVEKTISLSQLPYIESIITRFNFDDLKPSSIPIDPSQSLGRSQCPTTLTDIARMKNVPYREAVGALMYVSMGTRPDITFAVSTTAQFMDNPAWVHWEAVKRIFRYLKGTKDLELVYGDETKDLVGFVDADGASQEHRRAILGYVFMVDGGAVSWSSKKQELVTLSTTEAEYVAATHAAKEAVWLRRLLGEIFSPAKAPTTLFGDNQSAIALAHGGQYHARTKHINIQYHFIRYIIEAGNIRLIYCPTDDQTADTLTKALPSAKAKHFANAMGLRAV